MKITIVCDVLGEPNNGTTVATLNLIRFLKEKCGHSVKVVSNDFEKSGIPEEERCLLPTLSLGPVANKIIANNGVSLAKADHDILFNAMKDADVVHIQLPLLIGQTAVHIAKELGKPVTASFHCQAENVSAHVHLQNNELVSKAIYKEFYYGLYQYCDCIHYPTKFIRDVFEKAVKHKTNAAIISNGVNPIYTNKHLSRKNEKFVIVCSGRFSKEKAQQLLIKAVGKSIHRDEIKICFAGEGPLLHSYQKLALHLGVDADFTFYSRTALVELLNRANLYVHTAFIEIEAISCIEAICCGLVPVINNAKRSATKAFALDQRNLFRENSVKDLTKKIDYWIEHPDELEKTVEEYKKMAHQFDQEECMRMMEIMLCDAVEMHEKRN